jgi:hypothetical protein
MTSLMHKSILALLATLTLAAMLAATPMAAADGPKALLLNPNPGPGIYLPKFGFNSFNINGYGERVTYVQWGGLAAQMGLEPGDTVLSMNGFPLHYHGAWSDALVQALQSGGWVQLTIRDVRTGWIANRQLFVGNGGYGPVTPKYQVTNYGPTMSHIVIGNGGYNNYPVGPVTTKKMVGPHQHQNNMNKQIKQIVKLFED